MLKSSTNKLERRREGQCVIIISTCRQLVYSVKTWDTLLKREILEVNRATNMFLSKFLVDLS